MQQQGVNIMSSSEAKTEQNTDKTKNLRDKKVSDLVTDKRRLVEVPYTATLVHTMNALVANNEVAVPVAAPPGHWIGAGGSMIMESDRQTGVVRKHYIGIVTMLDILAHIGGDDDQANGGGEEWSDLDKKMAVSVSSIIGNCLEGLSLWTLNPSTSIVDCMEVFSKGIHRALVPFHSNMENIAGVELVESASTYRMLTQMDLIKFLKDHSFELQGIISRSCGEIGAVNPNVFAISGRMSVINAIRCMKAAMLNAVPIVVPADSLEEESKQLINGQGKKLIGTFSATDLRGCHLATLQTWLPLTALEFAEHVRSSPIYAATNTSNVPSRDLVTCYPDTPLAKVIDEAVTKHVHRVWVTDQQGLLIGLVSLSDIIGALHAQLD